MSERFPPLGLENELGRALDDEIKKFYGSDVNFKWKDDKGAPIGPFAVISYALKYGSVYT